VRALGYQVEMASDGVEALAKLALDVDLVLLDVMTAAIKCASKRAKFSPKAPVGGNSRPSRRARLLRRGSTAGFGLAVARQPPQGR